MGKSAPQAPPAPDYAAAATAQGKANLQGAQQGAVLSNPNIVSPYGNQTVTWGAPDPNNPDSTQQATVTQSLTPAAQAALDAQQQVQLGESQLAQQGLTQASGILGKPFQYQGPGVQTSVGASPAIQGSVGQAPGLNYGLQNKVDTSGIAAMPVNAGTTAQQAIMARLNPQIEQNNAADQQRLANQGLRPGSAAYDNAMRTEQQGNNDLYNQAALSGINVDMSANNQGYQQALSNANLYNQTTGQFNATAGQQFGQNLQSGQFANQAAGQAFNQNLQSAQFANTAQQQNLAQQQSLYNQPLNQITALMSGGQIQNPQFQAYTGQNVAPAPTFAATQAQGQYAQNTYAQQMAAYNAQMGGIGSIAGALGTAAGGIWSDRRLKSNVVRIGDHPRLPIGVYAYDIFGRREPGVMADEVLAVRPEAVSFDPSGYMKVDYGALHA